MFEKEAEEYQTEKRKTFNEYEQLCWGDVYKDFKNGAEFGYNKGYHDAEEHYMNVIDSQHKLVEESKANEWHYVKDRDLPKQLGYYLVVLKSIAYKGFVCEVVYFTGSIFTKEGEISDNVYAWKEIVLPELKESE